jgi:putative peptidoglycan lipid II flippase
MGVTYVNFVLPTTFGSLLPDGAISAYEYAWKLMQLPETLLGTAMGVVVFPTLSRLADEAGVGSGADSGADSGAELRHTFSWTLRLILALSVPAAVAMLLIGRPLTALLLQGGAFDATATDRVYLALQFFALGLVTHSALEVVARLFYAQRDMWTPMWAALGGLFINATLSWALLSRLAHGAIALGNSLGVGFQVAMLLALARRQLDGVGEGALKRSLMRTGAAAGLMGIAMLGLHALRPDPHGLERLLVGGIVYVVSALLLGSDELRQLPRLLLRE